MKRREHYAVPEYALQPEFQWLSDRRLLCLLCARVVATTAKAAHERGTEHKVALAEKRHPEAGAGYFNPEDGREPF